MYRAILDRVKRIVPKISDTEMIALNSGTTSIDRDIFNGKVDTIFREKQQVKQVSNGQECGITIKDYMDFQKNDTIEAFNVISKERTI